MYKQRCILDLNLPPVVHTRRFISFNEIGVAAPSSSTATRPGLTTAPSVGATLARTRESKPAAYDAAILTETGATGWQGPSPPCSV